MNVGRFILFLEEFYNCRVNNWYHFSGERDEYYFILEDKTQIKITEPNWEDIKNENQNSD